MSTEGGLCSRSISSPLKQSRGAAWLCSRVGHQGPKWRWGCWFRSMRMPGPGAGGAVSILPGLEILHTPTQGSPWDGCSAFQGGTPDSGCPHTRLSLSFCPDPTGPTLPPVLALSLSPVPLSASGLPLLAPGNSRLSTRLPSFPEGPWRSGWSRR